MGLRRGRPEDGPDLGALLLEGHRAIERTAAAHAARWGLGAAQRWDLDQADGLLRWTFPDRTAQAPAQLLGTHSPRSGTWRWAWANDSLRSHLRTTSEAVRAWGEQHGQAALTTADLDLDEEGAADLVALAFRIAGATGYYRAPAGAAHVHLVFGPVRLVDASGHEEVFAPDRA